jgi:hypothetical protein
VARKGVSVPEGRHDRDDTMLADPCYLAITTNFFFSLSDTSFNLFN